VTPAWAPDGRSRHLAWLGVLHLGCHALLTLLTPLYLAIQHDFGLARVEPVTALMTWQMLTFALATMVSGWLVDRVPGRLVAGGGLLLHGLALVGCARAETLAVARAWIILGGFGSAAYHPVAAKQIIGLFPHNVGRAIGLAAVGSAFGFYLGPTFAGWRAELAGWREPLWLGAAWRVPVGEAGLVAVLVAALYLATTREPRLTQREQVLLEPITSHDRRRLIGAVLMFSLLSIPREFAGIGVDNLHALYVQQSRGFAMGLGAVGSLLGLRGILSLWISPWFAALSDRGHRLRWWAAVMLGGAVCTALVPWLPPAWAKVAIVAQGVLILANYPILESALVERLPARVRGRAYAVNLAIIGTFAATAPKLVGARVDQVVGETAGGAPSEWFHGLYLALAAMFAVSVLAAFALGRVERAGRRWAG